MKNFVSSLFGSRRSTPPPNSLHSPSRDCPLSIEDGSENAARRQLVQVLLRDLLRKSGIPADWVECQMLLVSSRRRGTGMYVRLVLKHWDTRLMDYLPAFQNTLLADIRRFEPQANDWLLGIFWQFELEGSCPHQTLPGKEFWQEQEKPADSTPAVTPSPAPTALAPQVIDDVADAAPALTSFTPLRQQRKNSATADLERIFATRDKELLEQAGEGITPVGYEKTQPAPLYP